MDINRNKPHWITYSKVKKKKNAPEFISTIFSGLGMPINPIIGWATNLDTKSIIIQKKKMIIEK